MRIDQRIIPRFGKIIEGEMFGKSKGFKGKEDMYLPYDDSVFIVKKCQPSPESIKPFAQALRNKLLEKFNMAHDDEKIKFFTAVDSPLDLFHGVDGFIELKVGLTTYLRVTYDITANPQKNTCSADILIDVPESGLEINTKEFEQKVEKIATETREILKSKIEKLYAKVNKQNNEHPVGKINVWA
jgi:hypothetical protein